MIFLLDANVLIRAHNDMYPIDMFPEFWDWLLHMARTDRIKLPLETFEEVKAGPPDLLADWLGKPEVTAALMLQEEVKPALVQHVLAMAYGHHLTETEIEQIGQDPFMIAHALADSANRQVVTNEAHKPNGTRANRRVPNACEDVKVAWCSPMTLLKSLGFRTNWQQPVAIQAAGN